MRTDQAVAADYDDPMSDRLLGIAADVLRSFGSAFGGRHLAIVGGAVPSLLAPRLPTGIKPHVGTADLDLHLSLHLMDGETADYYQAIIDGLRSLGLRIDTQGGREIKWRWVGRYRGARLQVEFLCPARSRAGRPERPAAGTPAEANIGPGGEITALAVGFGHLVPHDTVTVERRVQTSRGMLGYEFPVAGLAPWLCLKADAIMRRDKPKDAYDVVWLIDALGPERAAEMVSASPLLTSEMATEVLGQLRRLVTDQFRDTAAAGPAMYASFLGADGGEGEAPLSLAYSALSALRSYVIGSGSALDNQALVLPTRRPLRAESYVSKVRFATRPGSFILTLALPLVEMLDEVPPVVSDNDELEAEQTVHEPVQETMFEVPPQPFGRRITNRMAAVARNAQLLADAVGAGDEPLRAFGTPGRETPNATELEALSGLGGPERSPYRLRFAQTPLAPQSRGAILLQITPGQQRIMAEAAVYLRTEQPRSDVTVEGVVVRLSRDHHYGPGVVVVEGVADDSGTARRYYLELVEKEYDEAIRAHRLGLRVAARGDLDTRGSYKWLRPARSFAIIPGLEDGEMPAN